MEPLSLLASSSITKRSQTHSDQPQHKQNQKQHQQQQRQQQQNNKHQHIMQQQPPQQHHLGEEDLFPPDNFSMVDAGIYRSECLDYLFARIT